MPPLARILPSTVAPPDYAEAVARLDATLATARRQPSDWLVEEKIATALMARARLTGDYNDFDGARAALDHAFATAGPRAGPHLAAAAFALQIHRLGAAEAMLAEIDRYAVPAEAEIRAETAAMRGDIAFYRGRYAEAARHYGIAQGLAPSAGLFARRSMLAARMGRLDDALADLDRAERTGAFTSPQAAAGLKLQRGVALLQAGRWAEAEARFAEADRIFPGHWLIEQHRAQMVAARGDSMGAIARYRAILARAANPETMDALAALYRSQGDYAQAQALAARAATLWEARLMHFPEAANAHAFDHYLAFGPAPRALDLAWADFRARPHGGSATALGWALLANGRPADALRMAQAAAGSGWVSAEAQMMAAEANALLGRGADADAARAAALAINPRITDRNAALLWLGH